MRTGELISRMAALIELQAEIIQAQAEALAQVGAAVMEEERAAIDRDLNALIGHDEAPDDVPAKADKHFKHEGCLWQGTALADYK